MFQDCVQLVIGDRLLDVAAGGIHPRILLYVAFLAQYGGLISIIGLTGPLQLREIEVGRYFNNRGAGAKYIIEQLLDLELQTLFNRTSDFPVTAPDGCLLTLTNHLREQLPGRVHDRHLVHMQVGNAVGNHHGNAVDPFRRKVCPGFQVEDYRGGGQLLFLKKLLLGYHQVNPAQPHLLHLVDRPDQLSFQGPLVVHPLHEGGHTHPLLVEELKPRYRAGGYARCSKSEPIFRHPVRRNVNGRAPGTETVRHPIITKDNHDLVGIFRRQIAVQQCILGPVSPQGQRNNRADYTY
ncbi:hypothetical protein ES707_09136 [subsurface metagenome]